MSSVRAAVPRPETRVVQDRFEACVYRPGQIARCPARAPLEPLNPEQLDLLLDEGDQRVGGTVFRTECPFCQACEPVRIDVDEFRASRSQRRAWKRNEGQVRVEMGPPALSRRRVMLWNRHRRVRGLLTSYSRKDPLGYHEWLVETCAPTVEVRYFEEDRMVGVSLLDLGRVSANSAYHYFDPGVARRSLGVYSVLKEIELCRSLGIRYYYLGLWAADSEPLVYKASYYPHERFVRGQWQRFEDRRSDPHVLDPAAYASAAASTRPGQIVLPMPGAASWPEETDRLDSEGPGEDDD
jgi:arginine-tRNA-protein transferase